MNELQIIKNPGENKCCIVLDFSIWCTCFKLALKFDILPVLVAYLKHVSLIEIVFVVNRNWIFTCALASHYPEYVLYEALFNSFFLHFVINMSKNTVLAIKTLQIYQLEGMFLVWFALKMVTNWGAWYQQVHNQVRRSYVPNWAHGPLTTCMIFRACSNKFFDICYVYIFYNYQLL